MVTRLRKSSMTPYASEIKSRWLHAVDLQDRAAVRRQVHEVRPLWRAFELAFRIYHLLEQADILQAAGFMEFICAPSRPGDLQTVDSRPPFHSHGHPHIKELRRRKDRQYADN